MKQSKLYRNQSGMAAIVITTVLMLVITITTLGFAQNVRREQRNALDHQLATQAFYAAESGVNLATNKIRTVLAGGGTVDSKDNCDQNYTSGNFSASDFNISNGVSVTCLLIKPLVPDLEYQKIELHAVPMVVKADSDIAAIRIAWQRSDATTTSAASCGNSIPASSFPIGNAGDPWNCEQPLLRVDIVPLPDSGNLVRSDLMAKQFTTFLYPLASGGNASINYAAGSVSNNYGVNCGSSPSSCVVNVNVAGAAYHRNFAVRISGMYRPFNLTVAGIDGSGTSLALRDQQVLIDVTAKAQDVLRRVQVRASLSGSGPDDAIFSGGDSSNPGNNGICKRYAVSAGVVTDPSGTYPACAIP